MHWSYCSHALSHRDIERVISALLYKYTITLQSLGQRILEGTNAPGGQNGAVDTSLSLDTRPLMGEDADVAEERKNILNTPTFQLEQQNTLILKVSGCSGWKSWRLGNAKVHQQGQSCVPL